jgi:hypothetical protein
MKTVICFDTEDQQGMNDAYEIMSYMCITHLKRCMPGRGKLVVNKIEFIKLLRAYAKQVEEHKADSGLKACKRYADHVWKDMVD